jgi:L-serine dehydratase
MMKEYSVFDVLGPIMIGPSSSHTAGAARLGKIAKEIAGENFNKVVFYLHGSFAKTYKGHGTDRALTAGILGMDPSDENLKHSLKIAKQKGIQVVFQEADLGYHHPNTAKIVFYRNDGNTFYIIGSSIGGGSILITNIDGTEVEFSGDLPTLIAKYIDKKGSISKITTILAQNNLNIATMKVTREGKGKEAYMVIETDSNIEENLYDELYKIDEMIYVKILNPISSR